MDVANIRKGKLDQNYKKKKLNGAKDKNGKYTTLVIKTNDEQIQKKATSLLGRFKITKYSGDSL